MPACTSVIIKNLPPDKCDEDTLGLYFSNKRKSGVDQYKSIKILANDTAVVDLEDEQSKSFLHERVIKEKLHCIVFDTRVSMLYGEYSAMVDEYTA